MSALMSRLAEVTVTGTTVSGSELVETVKTLLSGIFSLDNLVAIIGGALALGAGFVIFWFAYRFISRKVQKGMKKGGL